VPQNGTRTLQHNKFPQKKSCAHSSKGILHKIERILTLFNQSLSGLPLDAALGQLAIARVARTARIASRLARLPKFLELLSCTPRKSM
jgi:hypothetical protein